MKKRLGFIIGTALLIAAAVIIAILAKNYTKPVEEDQYIETRNSEVGENVFTLESDDLKFELSEVDTQFKVTNKKTNQVWYSSPTDVDDDPIALGSEKDRLKSTLLLTWSTKNGVDTIYDTYNYGVQNHNYIITQENDSIRVDYTIGTVKKEYKVPPAITVANLDAMMSSLSKSQKADITDYYKKYDINNLGKKDNKEELVERFPILETEPIYALRDTTKDNMKSKLEEVFEGMGYTMEDWERDKELDTFIATENKPSFNVSIIYRLDGDKLIAEVPLKDIEYRKKYPVYNITMLPYFGAGNGSAEGFMLVPEGSGAVINYNNGKAGNGTYYANLYGWDYAQERKALVHETEAAFNAFGVSNENGAFLCTIDGGAAYAAVQAYVSGVSNNYNVVNTEYNILHRNNYDVSTRTTATMYVYEENLPDESLIQTYHFLGKNECDYVDMAMEYRDYFLEKYPDTFTEVDTKNVPVNVEIVGAIDKVKQVFGVPTQKPHKLTTFDEASNIVSELKAAGVDNLSVKLSGWMNDGYEHTILKDVKVLSELGGKKGLTNFIDTAKSTGTTVYLDGVTAYAYNSGVTDGFMQTRDAAKFVSKQRAKLWKYSTIFYEQMKWQNEYFLLKGEEVNQMADNLVAAADKYGAGVSFRDYGSDLSADYNRKALFTRESVMKTQSDKLKEYQQSRPVMVNKGHDYAIAYADLVTNLDLTGINYTIIDKSVPFYELAIHGYVNYTGEPINLTQNYEDELLASAEYGAGLSFTFMNETAFELQSTFYSNYFGANYDSWKEKALSIYERYNRELGATFNKKMTNHEKINDLLGYTMYEDGTTVYVNYGDVEATVNGVTVPARDYKVVQ